MSTKRFGSRNSWDLWILSSSGPWQYNSDEHAYWVSARLKDQQSKEMTYTTIMLCPRKILCSWMHDQQEASTIKFIYLAFRMLILKLELLWKQLIRITRHFDLCHVDVRVEAKCHDGCKYQSGNPFSDRILYSRHSISKNHGSKCIY